MSRTVMMIMVDTRDNHNKFYELTELPDGRVQARYGRVDAGEQRRVYPAGSFDKKMNEKIRKGYVVRETTASSAKTSSLTVDSAQRVADSLFSLSDANAVSVSDTVTKSFAEHLLRNNRHAIADATGGKITVSNSGQVTTALGPVTSTQLSEARGLLTDLKGGARNATTIERYLVCIPQRVANLRKTDWIDARWFVSQDDLLDALDAALAASSDDDGDDATAPPPIPFRNKLSLLDSGDEFDAIAARFARSVNTMHTAAAYKLHRVWTIADGRRSVYDSVLSDLKHHRTLWHGTTAGNVLSILRTGLICPPMSAGNYATSGRMFGDGVYFSDQSTKSLNYAVGAWSRDTGSGNPMMFLADVAMGREYRPNVNGYSSNIPREARTGKDEKGRPYNSIFVRGGTCGVRNNEMIVWNTDQITLTHLCEFKR